MQQQMKAPLTTGFNASQNQFREKDKCVCLAFLFVCSFHVRYFLAHGRELSLFKAQSSSEKTWKYFGLMFDKLTQAIRQRASSDLTCAYLLLI